MAAHGSHASEELFEARAYQDEMLQQSMQQNIIVAADTGSGKTLIAILRIKAELETCPAGKFVWFCVPTVALAMQQYKAISTQLPAFQARVLSGADNVDFWTEQWIWDDILKGIRIVVSTHQVLLDVTPKLHREEMLKFVQRPKLEQLMYLASGTEQSISLALESLAVIYEGLDIEHDPWIIKMKADPSTADSSVLKKVMISHKTYCHEQIRGLYDRAFAIYKELGPWATDYYICYGRKNLIVTTNALEERRGRARKDISRYVIMFKDDGSQSDDLAKLLKLEEDMIEMYMDDMRKLEALRALEDIEEDGEQELRNESTGAKLTLDDAVQHLYHFCATLPAAPYVDQRPVFTFDSTSPGSEKNYFSAKVTLPNSVDASVREAHSVFRWKTEKMAKRDAAFEAYAALYRAGLINENFLPLGHVDESIDEAYTAIEKRPSLVAVAERLNPWLSVAQEWQGSENISTATIEIKEDKRFIAEMLMLLPCSIPSICPFTLHWNAATTYQAECKPGAKAYNPSHREAAMQVTYLLFQSHFGNRMDLDRCDFAALFIPSDVYDLREWASERSGTTKALDLRESDVQGNNAGIVRDLSENSKPYIFHDVHYDCFEDADLDDTMDIDQYEKEHQAYSTGAEYADCSCESSKWRPIYNGNLLKDQPPETREMSSKTLADVVEALLGAAYLDGGTEKALICLNIFLPEIPWFSALQASEILHKAYSQQTPTVSHLSPIEKLIAYEFGVKSLLIEALTHASHHGPNSSASYQRLEFLGDSVLDNIVTTTAFSHEPPIATHNLHLVRAALVNGNFLGYLCLTLFTSLQRAEIVANDPKNVSTVQTSYPFYLWQAMRHASPAVSSAQQECLARLETVSDELAAALANGSSYPWTLLARLEPPKFLSDIIESLLGAIYIDTRGSLAQCESFLENLGLMAYLRRVMHNRIAILHPKEQLGQLSNQDTVKYVLGKEGEEGGMRLTCTVMVGQRQVVRVDDGLSVMEVQTRAADAACKVLRGEGREIRNNMGYSNGPRVNETRNEAGAEEEEAEEEETGEVESRVEANKEKEAWKEKGNLAQEDERMGAIDYDSDEYMTAHE
ncbi:endoribonuclease Dicer, partial [Lecanoromycetidae sp. Uapishka_2]